MEVKKNHREPKITILKMSKEKKRDRNLYKRMRYYFLKNHTFENSSKNKIMVIEIEKLA